MPNKYSSETQKASTFVPFVETTDSGAKPRKRGSKMMVGASGPGSHAPPSPTSTGPPVFPTRPLQSFDKNWRNTLWATKSTQIRCKDMYRDLDIDIEMGINIDTNIDIDRDIHIYEYRYSAIE